MKTENQNNQTASASDRDGTGGRMTEKSWSNYETWLVSLWIDNEEYSQSYWAERAQTILGKAEAGEMLTRKEEAIYTLAAVLKDSHEEEIADKEVTGFAADLLNSAMSEVNWQEIATSLLEDCEQEAA